MSKIKIAIDVGPLSTGDSVRGIGAYTRELIGALEKIQKNANDSFEIYQIDYFNHQSSTINHYNVVHLTRFNPFRISVPFKKSEGIKYVLTIYDLIPLIYPKHYPPGIKGWIKWQINKYLIKKNVDTIITISETSKKDICRFTGIDPKKVVAIHLAPRPCFRKLEIDNSLKNENFKLKIAKRYHLPDRFALYVGDINYNKNIPNLVKACKLANISLVIAGKQAADMDNVDLNHPENIHLKGVNWENVQRLGFVTDEDLVNLYNLADVYIQPSFYEGFGLPLLEAFACGTPIVVSKNQCHVEVLGPHFIYVDPGDSSSIAKGIQKPNINKKLPRDYSWAKTAKETLEVYVK